jgi:hypothetical protein
MFSPEEIGDLIEVAKEYVPVVEVAIDELAPVLDKMFSRLSCYMQQGNVEAMEFYLQNGFSREEALLLIINSSVALQKMADNMGKNKKEI